MATVLPINKIQVSPEINAALALAEQTTSDLGFQAAQQIIKTQNIDKKEIGALVFLSKTPDYRGPATSMVLQNRLGIPQNCIVYDSPTGNGGFENALNIGAALLNSVQQNYILLVFGDTVSKQLNFKDFKDLNFQDGATAILLEKNVDSAAIKLAFLTKSKFWKSFIVPSGGFRESNFFFNDLSSKRVEQKIEHLHINDGLLEEALKPEFNQVLQKVNELSGFHKDKKTLVLVNLLLSTIEEQFKVELIQSGFQINNIFLQSETGRQTMSATTPLMLENILNNSHEIENHVVSISLGEGLSINIASFLTYDSLVQKTIYSDSFYDNGFVTHEM